jgi:hypothetical protein
MNENETTENVSCEVVETNSRKMKRINRRYMMSTVGRGIKWGLIAVGTVTVAKSLGRKTEDYANEFEK